MDNTYGSSSQAVRADKDIASTTTDVTPPIHLSTTFRHASRVEEFIPAEERPAGHAHFYTRISHPNVDHVEAVLSKLLHGDAIVYSSGLSASYAVMSLLNPGVIAFARDTLGGYHGTLNVASLIGRLSGMKRVDLEEAESTLGQGDCIWLESPLNPLGTSYDIEKYAELAHGRGSTLVVDATFAPPPLQNPFEHGADIVVHSATKYLGGHSDVLAGVVVVKDAELAARFRHDRAFFGTIPAPQVASLLLRSLRTFPLRIAQHSKNAVAVADHLHQISTQPELAKELGIAPGLVSRVTHTSLQSEPFVARHMTGGHSPTFSVFFSSEQAAKLFCSDVGGLKIFDHATSLGGAESLVEWRRMTDAHADKRLVRLSIGLEDAKDLVADLNACLTRVSKALA